MHYLRGLGFGFLLAGLGCSEQIRTEPQQADRCPRAWPQNWASQIGKSITLEGTAANTKLGAVLLGESGEIWIDGLDAWPDGFYLGGDRGKRLRVTGTVIERHDLPVFIQKEGELPRQGIP